MSATLEGTLQMMKNYFAQCGIIGVGSRPHDVDIFHLGETMALTNFFSGPTQQSCFENESDGEHEHEQERQLEQMRTFIQKALTNRPSSFQQNSMELLRSAYFNDETFSQLFHAAGGGDYRCGINYGIIVHIVKYIIDSPVIGAILVFLPEDEDINKL